MTLRYDTFYKIKVGNNLGDPNFWNPILEDIDLRLNAAELQYAKFDSAAQSIIAAGIDRINNTLQPLINAQVTAVNNLAAQVAALNDSINSESGSTTAQLNALLAEAEAAVANLESLGVIDGGTF